MAGLRVEMRRKPSASSWPDVENDVKHYFDEVSKRLTIKQIAPKQFWRMQGWHWGMLRVQACSNARAMQDMKPPFGK